jgi:hypothetical protein
LQNMSKNTAVAKYGQKPLAVCFTKTFNSFDL